MTDEVGECLTRDTCAVEMKLVSVGTVPRGMSRHRARD